MSPELAQTIERLVAAGFIVFFGFGLFNRPVAALADATLIQRLPKLASTSRSSTTALSFYGAMTAYLMTLLAAWWILMKNAVWLDQLLRAAGEEPTAQLSPALLSALLLTVLLPRIPYLSKVEAKFREFLQRMAQIPDELRRQVHSLEKSGWVAPAKLQQKVDASTKHNLLTRKLRKAEEGVFQRFNKATSLLAGLESWAAARKFSVYQREYQDVLDQVEAEYQKTAKNIELYEKAAKELGANTTAVQAHLDHLEEKTSVLLRMVLAFIAGGVLYCGWTETLRQRELRKLGFAPKKAATAPLTASHIALILMSLFSVLVLGFAAIGRFTEEGIGKLLLLITMIASMLTWAAVSAIVVVNKLRAGRTQKNLKLRDRPYLSYLLVGAVAFGLGVLTATLFKSLVFGSNLAGLIEDVRLNLPWQVITVTVAFGTALILDTEPPEKLRGWKLHLAEGAGLALLVGGTSVFVQPWLVDLAGGAADRIPGFWQVVGMASAIGLVMGASIPAICRERMS